MPPNCRVVGLLEALGGEPGCRQLSAEFYSRVAKDLVLRSLFPGKSLRCATDEFAAFLIQFLGGDEDQTQDRWWLSLRESHGRFQIDATQRKTWLKHMGAAVEAAIIDKTTRQALKEFFRQTSLYVVGEESVEPKNQEFAARWNEQRILDKTINAIATGCNEDVIALAPRFVLRPSVFLGLLARMVQSEQPALIEFVMNCLEQEPSLCFRSFAGRTLLHFASGAGCLEVVVVLLRLGANPNSIDRGGHTSLYSVANECSTDNGPKIVRTLVHAGTNVNACGGVTRATALHMAARRGNREIAHALIDCGAILGATDRKGDTPLRRAINCRQDEVAKLLVQLGAVAAKRRK